MKKLFLALLLSNCLSAMETGMAPFKFKWPWSQKEEEISSSDSSYTISVERSSEDEEEKDASIEKLSRRAISFCFDARDGVDVRQMTFSKATMQRIQQRLHEKKEDRTNLQNILMGLQYDEPASYESLSPGEKESPRGQDGMVKEVKELVLGSLEEVFTEKDRYIIEQENKVRSQQIKFKIAALGAFTTTISALIGGSTALILHFTK